MFQLLPILLAYALGLAAFSIEFPQPVTYDAVLNPNVTISYQKHEPGTGTTAVIAAATSTEAPLPKLRRQSFLGHVDNPDDRKERDTMKKAIIGGLAGLGGLLLLLTLLASCCLGWRYNRSKKHNRRFMGGSREPPSPLPTAEPAPQMKMAERPDELPPLERPTRRLSAPMEPIPEASPLPSVERRAVTPPPKEHQEIPTPPPPAVTPTPKEHQEVPNPPPRVVTPPLPPPPKVPTAKVPFLEVKE